MAETATITLAKALKLKNRLAGRVANLTGVVRELNSAQQGAEDVDVTDYYARRAEAVARLVDLKAAILTANRPIQRDIYLLAEKKAEIAMLAGLDTKHGTFREAYATADTVYVAKLRKADVPPAPAPWRPRSTPSRTGWTGSTTTPGWRWTPG